MRLYSHGSTKVSTAISGNDQTREWEPFYVGLESSRGDLFSNDRLGDIDVLPFSRESEIEKFKCLASYGYECLSLHIVDFGEDVFECRTICELK